MSFDVNEKDLSPDVPSLKPLHSSSLYLRRYESKENHLNDSDEYDDLDDFAPHPFKNSNTENNASVSILFNNHNNDKFEETFKRAPNTPVVGECAKCTRDIFYEEKIIATNGKIWHEECFVCVQCFRRFKNGMCYEHRGRYYCRYDYEKLYAPICSKCETIIIGKVVMVMDLKLHLDCFACETCHIRLIDNEETHKYYVNNKVLLCAHCNGLRQKYGYNVYKCSFCSELIDDNPLRYRGEFFHHHHLNCSECGLELDEGAKVVSDSLLCSSCYYKSDKIPKCGACRRPIEERPLFANGKHWHIEHFVCFVCRKPLKNRDYLINNGLVYCEKDYIETFGNVCFICNKGIKGDVYEALNKTWCYDHISCWYCNKKVDPKTFKFFNIDMKPICKKCYTKLPKKIRNNIKKHS